MHEIGRERNKRSHSHNIATENIGKYTVALKLASALAEAVKVSYRNLLFPLCAPLDPAT